MRESLEIESLRTKHNEEQTKAVQRLHYLQIPSFVFGGIKLITAILFVLKLPCATALGVLGYAVLVIGGIAANYFWLKDYDNSVTQTNDLTIHTIPYRRTASVIFSSSVGLALTIFVLVHKLISYSRLISMLQAMNSDADTWKSEFGDQSLNSLSAQVQTIYIISAICLTFFIVYFILSCIGTYRALDYINRGLCHFTYFSNIFLMVVATILIVFSTYCLGYKYYDEVYTRYPISLVHLLRYVGVAVFITSIVVLLTNTQKSNRGYFTSSVMLGVLSLVLLVLTIASYKHSRSIQTELAEHDNCYETLKRVNYRNLNHYGCPVKFFRDSDNSDWDTNCPITQQGIVWEDQQDVPNENKQYKTACLNGACCKILGEYFGESFYFLSSLSLAATIITCFVLAATSRLYSANWMDESVKPRRIDRVWMGVSGGLFIVMVILCLLNMILPNGILRKAYINDFGSLQFKEMNPSSFRVLDQQHFGDRSCYPLEKVVLHLRKRICNRECKKHGFEVKLLGEDGRFTVNNPENINGLSFSINSSKKESFPEAQDKDDYLYLSGYPGSIAQAFEKRILFCPNQPGVDAVIHFKATQKELQLKLETNDSTVVLTGSSNNNKAAVYNFTGSFETIMRLHLKTNDTQKIYGQVNSLVDGTARPVKNANILLKRGHVTLHESVTTNATGWFQADCRLMRDHKPFYASVIVEKEGYRTIERTVQVGGFPYSNERSLGTGLELVTTTPRNHYIPDYGTLFIQVYDGDRLKHVNGADIYIFNNTDLTKLDDQSPAVTAQSDSTANVAFTKMTHGYYTIEVDNNDYKIVLDYVTIDGPENFFSYVLWPEDNRALLTVVYQNLGDAPLYLAANFVYNSTAQCLVNPVNKVCSGMEIGQSDTLRSVLHFRKFGDFDYIVYVRKFNFEATSDTSAKENIVTPDEQANAIETTEHHHTEQHQTVEQQAEEKLTENEEDLPKANEESYEHEQELFNQQTSDQNEQASEEQEEHPVSKQSTKHEPENHPGQGSESEHTEGESSRKTTTETSASSTTENNKTSTAETNQRTEETVTDGETKTTTTTTSNTQVETHETRLLQQGKQQASGLIRIYVNGFQQQVMRIHFPQVTYLSNDQDFQWLAFCISGREGPISIIPLNLVQVADQQLDNPLGTLCGHYLHPE